MNSTLELLVGVNGGLEVQDGRGRPIFEVL